ncbi:DUF4236 domain-containing protein [Phaeobacter italicus]|uniref:DUF4236 domain-containing protein n=1 Tax=Phaeobacter italicus TaxID=481446 RepID=UPI003CD0C6DC
MAFRFRRSIRIAPGVRINLSKSGVSTTIGPRGASLNFGKRGVYANLGLPGTGLSYRKRLKSTPKPKVMAQPETVPTPRASIAATGHILHLSRACRRLENHTPVRMRYAKVQNTTISGHDENRA